MKITFLGAAREVTGSKHLIEVNGKKILLDYGLFQGNRKKADEKNKELLVDPSTVDVVILSHAHIDHSGALPYLVKNGFTGDIITSHATKDICNFMLMDSAFIQQREVEFMNRHKLENPVEPLYTEEDAVQTLQQFKTIDFHTKTEIFEGVSLTFLNAGHILGAAMISLEIIDKDDDNKLKRLTFTGDLGRKEATLLKNPDQVESTDYLIMESTYGNRFHKWIKDVDDHMADLINETASKGGKIIIPAFALERTQEVVYYLNLLQKNGRIPSLPVFVDSPLAVNVTQVFKDHTSCYNKEIQEEFISDKSDPFGFERLTYVHKVEDSKQLNNKQGPMIIISASGMCEFGRVLHHLRNNIEDPRNLVLIVGYQAENTLGRKLIDNEKQVRIFGETKRVKARIAVLDAFSGHADRSDLIDFVTHIQDVKKIFLVHGEEDQGLTFSQILKEIKPTAEVFVPSRADSFVL
jgi:metallo-beta-lactamase family protein